MSHKRSNQLTVTGEWAKHLRPHGRRAFWKGERTAAKAYVATEVRTALEECASPPMPMKVQELLARLETEGWYLARQIGSHRPYRHATNRGTVNVSCRPSVEIPRGTLNSILKVA